eukprot:13130154-Alexandrium_andersonii.AAC.1
MAALLGGAPRPLTAALAPASRGHGEGEEALPEARLREALAALAADFSRTAQAPLAPGMVASLQVHAARAFVEGGLKADMWQCLAAVGLPASYLDMVLGTWCELRRTDSLPSAL